MQVLADAAAADSASARAQQLAAPPAAALGAWGKPRASLAAFAGSAAAATVNPAAAAPRADSKPAVAAAPAADPRATVASAGGAWGKKAPAAASSVPAAAGAEADSRALSSAVLLPAICVSLVLQWMALRDLVRAQRCSKIWLSAAASPLVTRPPAAAAADFAQRLLDASDDAEPIAALFVPAGLSASLSSAAATLQLRSTHPLCASLIGASLIAPVAPPTVREDDYGVARNQRDLEEMAAGLAVLTALPRLAHFHLDAMPGMNRLRQAPLPLWSDASVQNLRTLSLKQHLFLMSEVLGLIEPLQQLEAIELCYQQLQYAGNSIPLGFALALSKLPRLAYVFFSVGSSFVSRRSDMEELRALVQCCPSLQLIRWAHPCPQTLFSSTAKLAPVRLVRRVHVPAIRDSIDTLQSCLDLFPDLQELSFGSVPWPAPQKAVPFPASLCEVLRAFAFRAEDANSLMLVLRSLCASPPFAHLEKMHLTRASSLGATEGFEQLYASLLSRLPMLTNVNLENLPLTDAATLDSVAPRLRTLGFVPASMLTSRDSVAHFLDPFTALRTLRVRMASDPLASAKAVSVLRARPCFQRIVVGRSK